MIILATLEACMEEGKWQHWSLLHNTKMQSLHKEEMGEFRRIFSTSQVGGMKLTNTSAIISLKEYIINMK